MLDLPEHLMHGPSDSHTAALSAAPPITDGAGERAPEGGFVEGAAELRPAAQAVWKNCLDLLRPQLSPQTFRTWFDPIVPMGLSGSELLLRAPSSFFCEWITEHYQSIVDKALKEVLGSSAHFRFDIVTELEELDAKLEPARPAAAAPAKPALPTPIPQMPHGNQSGFSGQSGQQGFGSGQNFPGFGNQNQQAPQNFQGFPQQQQQQGFQQPYQQSAQQQGKRQNFDSNLNPRYTFDTFIRGESNKLAYAAAMAVANNPGGTRYNPLVIYGNVGLGKTHVIQAVGNAVVQKYQGARVLYTSSDRFTVEFVDAVQNDRINEFQSLYRSIDVLIIDDVQFFAGKEKTQDIFFHSFNALRELGKQIILTCDRPPKELKDIDDRLLNRLQWGLTADIGAPDLETRIAILRHKAISDGIDLPNDVIEFIATNVTTNIRELEGCLISLLATASLEGREPTIEVAKEVLRKVAKRSAPILSIETIQRSVAKKFGIEEELLRAKTRKQEVVQARQVAMYLAKELTNSSLKTIGLHFGGRDHSTVIHACQTVADDMRHNTGLQSKVEELRRQFELLH
jgi:chromosomal replication initiator protein